MVAAQSLGSHGGGGRHLARIERAFDCLVIGGGIVGLATAREWLLRHPKCHLAVVEKESDVGLHQTGHNSGVIHAGMYYTPGSLKSKLCVRGMHLAYEYIKSRGLPHRKCGKVIVATSPGQVDRLAGILERGRRNGVPKLELLDRKGLLGVEPHCTGGIAAILSPETGITDWREVARSYAEDVEKSGGAVVTSTDVVALRRVTGSGWQVGLRLHGEGDANAKTTITTKHLIACAGLQSDRVARLAGGSRSPAIVPIRGEYLSLPKRMDTMIRGAVYPVPDPSVPFLGLHFTPTLSGTFLLGPNALPSLSREGYHSRRAVALSDVADLASFPGTWRLAGRMWPRAVHEARRALWRRGMAEEVSAFFPDADVTAGELRRAEGRAGLRAQAVDASGSLVEDFALEVEDGMVQVRNAPSPGATAALAIAEVVADTAESEFFGSGRPRVGLDSVP